MTLIGIRPTFAWWASSVWLALLIFSLEHHRVSSLVNPQFPEADKPNHAGHEHNFTISAGVRELLARDKSTELIADGGLLIKWSSKRQKPSNFTEWLEESKTTTKRRRKRSQHLRNYKIDLEDCGRDANYYRVNNLTRQFTATNNKRTTRPIKARADLNRTIQQRSMRTAGHSLAHHRILNGRESEPGQFPFVVEIKIFDGVDMLPKRLCTGTIVSQRLIMTAAHCAVTCGRRFIRSESGPNPNNRLLNLEDPSKFSALIGRRSIGWWALNIARADIQFQAIILPSNIDSCQVRAHHDYAFLVTDRIIHFEISGNGGESSVSSICLPTAKDLEGIDQEETLATAVGWGETYAGSGRSNELRWGHVTIQPKRFCSTILPDDFDQVYCTTGPAGACRGDSGGPLMIMNNENRWIQIGVYSAFSSHDRVCSSNMVMLFKKVSFFWRWAIKTFSTDEIMNTIGAKL